VRRRDFISLVGGAAATWPLLARAQQPEQMRRIGVLMFGLENDPEQMARLAAFRKALQQFGWTADANVVVDVRFGVDHDDLREKAKELVNLAPDVVLATPTPSVIELRKVTRTIPIVFAAATDPVGFGIVQSLAHPGGNATGFLSAEFGFGTKWLELLKEVAPAIRKVGILTSPDNPSATPQFAAIQGMAPSVGMELRPVPASDDGEIERGITDFARSGGGGLIALRLVEVISHRQLIIKLAAQHRLPAIYPFHIFASDGGLISYGPDLVDELRRAAGYVNRILKGEKPADLPVQAPDKFELVINVKAAKALGLTIPPAMLSRADEVIE
jgi:putative ABC transport system substrate-binding protein